MLGRIGSTGLPSLLAAVVTVLGVLAFAVAAYSGSPVLVEPEGEQVFFRSQPADVYVRADRLAAPVVFMAGIEVDRWVNREQRILEATIRWARAEVGEGRNTDGPIPSEVGEQITGLRALLSVNESAQTDLPETGVATVRLVVMPKGEAASLLIDSVLKGEEAVASVGTGDGEHAAGSPLPLPVSNELMPTNGAADGPETVADTGSVIAAGGPPVVETLSTSAAAPGSKVTITGRNFGTTQRDSWVVCANAQATAVTWSDTSVTFVVPSDATSPGYVGVVVNGVTSNGLYFVPFSAPYVDSITPRTGPSGTEVEFVGSNFGHLQGSGWVTFAGTAGQVLSWSDTSITAVVPKGATAGYAGVVAHTLTSNGKFYAPYGAPVITAVSARRATSGDTVVLSGRNLGSTSGVVVVGGRTIEPSEWTATRVSFTVPAEARSGYAGIVTDAGWTSNGMWIGIAPRLTALSRWWAPPGERLTVEGSGFGSEPNGYRVTVGGVEAQVLQWGSAAIDIEVPATAKTGYVGVGTSGVCSNGLHLVVETRAHIEDVVPRSASPGQRVEILGRDFGKACSSNRVLIGGTAECPVVEWSSERLVVEVPADAASGYIGVVKQGVSSNGIWMTIAP